LEAFHYDNYRAWKANSVKNQIRDQQEQATENETSRPPVLGTEHKIKKKKKNTKQSRFKTRSQRTSRHDVETAVLRPRSQERRNKKERVRPIHDQSKSQRRRGCTPRQQKAKQRTRRQGSVTNLKWHSHRGQHTLRVKRNW